MNNGNLLLKEKLRYLGFGGAVASSDRLDTEIEKGTAEFQLETAASFDEWTTLHATLFFRKSDNFDIYFFSRYTAHLIYDSSPTNNKMQTFLIKNGSGVTFKEAFNLLQGRSVYTNLWDSDDVKYSSWIKLSFSERTRDNINYRVRQYGEKYEYDLEKILGTYPIRELQDEKLKMNLLYSLQKGNVHPVTFLKANKVERVYVEASPATKGLKLYSEAIRALQRVPGKGY